MLIWVLKTIPCNEDGALYKFHIVMKKEYREGENPFVNLKKVKTNKVDKLKK